MDFLDDAVETAVDVMFDRAESWVSKLRDQQLRTIPEEVKAKSHTCAVCRKTLPFAHFEQLHPTNGYGTCKPCYREMWVALSEKVKAMGRQASRRAAAAADAAPPRRPPPWEILGISADASADDVRKAWRRRAAECHPDTIPPGASAEERERARAAYEEVTRARDAMLSVRQPPRE